MQFGLSEEQVLLQDSVNRFLEETTLLFGVLPAEFIMLFKSKKLSWLIFSIFLL